MTMKYMVCILALLVALPACTLVTDFSEPEDDLYSLDENLGTSITVALSGDTATLTLSFAEPLPGTTDDDAAMLALITGGTVGLTVANDVTNVSFNLNQDGSHVDAPAGPGEYHLALGSDRSSIAITFYNEVAGVSLYAGGDYSGAISVQTNDWFETEDFVRDVTVQ